MTKVDQFESVFRSADKPVFHHRPIEIERALVITDLEPAEAAAMADRVQAFLPELGEGVAWTAVGGEAGREVEGLLALVEEHRPDLVCTWRNLYSQAWRWPYGLGRHLDVLTQAVHVPVLVLPHPRDGDALARALAGTEVVMAMAGHLAGDDSLVSWAARLTRPEGTLWLVHVENEAAFERFIDAISKIPDIDTEQAREGILAQLLKEPRDFVASCRKGLAAAGLPIRVQELVAVGHHLFEYRRLVEEHRVSLLVMHAKDEDQMAMHGLAWPLAVELRATPLLLL